MVRLRRELEGIHLDRSVPPPHWAMTPLASAQICPSWSEAVRGLEATRLLFCGIADEDLALGCAAAGKWVTLSDLEPGDVRRISEALDPDVASRVQLVAKPYGSATFSPSSFDAIIFCDQLDAYDAPTWVLQKVKRELKVDGTLLARLCVAGPLGDLPGEVETPLGASPPRMVQKLIRRGSPLVAEIAHSAANALWLNESGLDAVGRRALWSREGGISARPNRSFAVQFEAIKSRLHVEEIRIGSTLRAAALCWGAGARPTAAGWALRMAGSVPELADEADRKRHDLRVVWVRARRALMVGGKALTFG